LRIASVHSAFGERGGAERVILEQAHHLSRKHDVTVFGTYVWPEKCYPDLLEGLNMRQLVGIPVRKFDLLTNAAFGLFLSKGLANQFRSFDVLISHQEPAHWIAYCARRPYIVQIHSLLTILYPEFFRETYPWDTDYDRIAINLVVDAGFRSFLRWIDETTVHGAQAVLVEGRKIGDYVNRVYGVRCIQVPTAIDITKYQWSDPTPVFRKYSIRPPLILMVTRSLPSKRPDIMIRILPKILQSHPTATLVIACGESRYNHLWNNLARRLGVAESIRILSVAQPELRALYSGAAVLGYPSQAFEAVGRVVAEGMAFGVPSVVWDDGWGPAELVKNGAGLRAQPYDIDDFTDKCLALLNDEEMRRRMGDEAKRYVETKLSWENAMPHIVKVLERAAGQEAAKSS